MLNYVKNTTFVKPLDLLFPHSCRGCGAIGEVICKRCKNHIFKTRKSPTNLPTNFTIYAISSREGLLKELIHDYKYHSIRALARPLAELLNSSIPASLPQDSIIVPLPTATHHIRARGLDHTLLIAKHLAKLRHLKVEKLLLRNKNTVQVGTDRSTRLSQAKSAYILNPKIRIKKDATYILLDDVWTTGASITAAKNILETAGAKDIRIAILTYSTPKVAT